MKKLINSRIIILFVLITAILIYSGFCFILWDSYYIIPIVFIVPFAIYILTQSLEQKGITMKQRGVMKKAYNVCTIVFLILLYAAAIATLIFLIIISRTYLLLGLILILLLVIVTTTSTCIARSLQKRFAKYVLNAEGLWVPSLIIIAHIIVNLGMIFACWLAWFGALVLLAAASGVRFG